MRVCACSYGLLTAHCTVYETESVKLKHLRTTGKFIPCACKWEGWVQLAEEEEGGN